jgi:hypothetical protein
MAFTFFTPRAPLTSLPTHILRAPSIHSSADTSLYATATTPSLVLTAVTTFDGSQLTDTIVVSNSFWNNLASKLPALLLAEVLASVAFVVMASVLIAQGRFLLDVASKDEVVNKNFARRNTNGSSMDLSKLFLCIIIDVLGSANEAIPLAGEVVDVIYAPIAALLLRQLFQGSNVVFLLEFVEEILPFTDVLPLATICWVVEAFFGGSGLARALRIGDYGPTLTRDMLDDKTRKGSMKDASDLGPMAKLERELDETD